LVARLARLSFGAPAPVIILLRAVGDPLHQATLLVGGLILVKDSLGSGHINGLHGQAESRRFIVAADSGTRLGASTQLGLDGLFVLAVLRVLLIALIWLLIIRHERQLVLRRNNSLRGPIDATRAAQEPHLARDR